MVLSLLAACGGGGGGSGSGQTNLKVTMTDFKFDPANVSVPAGQQITVSLTNNGSVEHSWGVLKTKAAGSTITDADKANLLAVKVVPPGGTDTLTFTAPAEAGDYQVVCDVPGHFEAGMAGTLTVTK